MPLPDPPPLPRLPRRSKAFKQALYEANPEGYPTQWSELEHVLYDKDFRKSTGLRCRTCFRFHRCSFGKQQMFQCFAYWLWDQTVSTNPIRSEREAYFLTLPLTEDSLKTLSVADLLGIYFYRRYSLRTVINLSPQGLRERLLEIAREDQQPDPYRICTT